MTAKNEQNAAISITADRTVGVEAFIDLLERSTLAARRPVGDHTRIAQMLSDANLTLMAWDGDLLVGISRCLTDFAYVCYCSDLAVDVAYQGRGIGKALLLATKAKLHPKASLLLRAAPAAVSFYEHAGPEIGLEALDRFFGMLPKDRN